MLNMTFSLGKINAYIDGKLIQNTYGKTNYQPTNAPLEIGHWWSSNNFTRLFNGLIDEVRIYNRALSDSEILSLYNATK